jgi:hypothetical protein
MNAHQHAATGPFSFHVNLADDWERRYLAARLGVSEEALRASSPCDDPTVEEIFDTYCPVLRAEASHAQLHRRLAESEDGV